MPASDLVIPPEVAEALGLESEPTLAGPVESDSTASQDVSSGVPVDFVPQTKDNLRGCLADPVWRLCSGYLYKIMVKSAVRPAANAASVVVDHARSDGPRCDRMRSFRSLSNSSRCVADAEALAARSRAPLRLAMSAPRQSQGLTHYPGRAGWHASFVH